MQTATVQVEMSYSAKNLEYLTDFSTMTPQRARSSSIAAGSTLDLISRPLLLRVHNVASINSSKKLIEQPLGTIVRRMAFKLSMHDSSSTSRAFFASRSDPNTTSGRIFDLEESKTKPCHCH